MLLGVPPLDVYNHYTVLATMALQPMVYGVRPWLLLITNME